MRSRVAAALILATALACNRKAPPPPAKPTSPAAQEETSSVLTAPGDVDIDADNLLNLAYGASVVSRSAESNLELSAVHAIDGISRSSWSSPPGGAVQSLTFALAARSRIEQLGITSSGTETPKEVRFEASDDGTQWREVLVQKLEATNRTQIVDVKPFEARYLRVETTVPRAYFATLRSVHALGRELEAAARRDFGGCWTINGLDARLVQDGPRIAGVIATTPPTYIEGGYDGRVALVLWLRPPNYGYATLSMDPVKRVLSGLTFYEEISTQYITGGWFGRPCTTNALSETTPGMGAAELSALMDRAGRWSIYGLAFDAREHLLEKPSEATLSSLSSFLRARPAQRFRIVFHELHLDAPQERTTARSVSLRASLAKRGVDVAKIEFVATGSTWKEPPIIAAIQRLMASRIDLEIVK